MAAFFFFYRKKELQYPVVYDIVYSSKQILIFLAAARPHSNKLVEELLLNLPKEHNRISRSYEPYDRKGEKLADRYSCFR